MSPDEQEAASRKYGNDPFCVLPLSSGNFAVLSVIGRHVIGIASDLEGVLELGKQQPEYIQRAKDGYYVNQRANERARAKIETQRQAKKLGLTDKDEIQLEF